LKNESKPQLVILADFELSPKQFQLRYTNLTTNKTYRFDKKFIRAEINTDNEKFDEEDYLEKFIIRELEKVIIKTGAKILIIDNVTFLGNELEKSKQALPMMKQLKKLKNRHKISILVLGHTPKRDLSKPITRNDVAGSKTLMTFCDSAFALGESKLSKRTRYLKQIKQRNCEQVYDEDNVLNLELQKNDCFLGFEITGFGTEAEHLKTFSESEKKDRLQLAIEMRNEGKNNVEIAKKFGVSEGTVRSWFKKAEE
jgi:predicted transcriptional regulator